MKQEKNIKERLKDVKAFVFDVDGVLSTSHIPLYPGGEPMRVINTKDGYALHQASIRNYPLAILTGGKTDADWASTRYTWARKTKSASSMNSPRSTT